MAKATKPGFYAVQKGHRPGVYRTWDECKKQTDGAKGAIYKKFSTENEAQSFVNSSSGYAKTDTGAGGQVAGQKRASSSDDGPVKRQKPSSSSNVFVKSIPGRTVYCDGSSRGNGKKNAVAGIGVFWAHEIGAPNLSERLPGPLQTNNRAEMYAVARILETDPTPEVPLTICTDSAYTIGVFSTWLEGWKKRNWRNASGDPVANQDLIRYVLSLLALRTSSSASSSASTSNSKKNNTANITFQKVKAHVGIEGNEQADRLANHGAFKDVLEDRDYAKDTRENEKKLREKKGAGVKVEDVEWLIAGIEEGDLLDEDELRELEEKQAFD